MRPETRERIAATVKALDYHPNGVARQLKTGRTPMLGLLVPSVANPFFGELAAAVEGAAQKRGYRVILCNTLRNLEKERGFAEELVAHGVRGLITASALTDPLQMMNLARRKAFVVALDARRSDVGVDFVDVVTMDNNAATNLAVDHLVSLGHERIAYVTGPGNAFSRTHRLNGYRGAMARHGLAAPLVIVAAAPGAETVFGDSDLAGLGRRAVRDVLALTPRPTAIVALNDMTAAGVLAGLRQHGLSVPNDISVVGVDDAGLAGLLSPPLTTVRQPVEEMADMAVSRLVERLAGENGPGTEVVFEPRIVIRGSTGQVPAAAAASTAA